MTIGIVGKKIGMTRIFTDEGKSLPVTVIEAQPNRVTQIKTIDRDGYSAVQVTKGKTKNTRVNKPSAGLYSKVSVEAGEGLWEFRLNEHQTDEIGDCLLYTSPSPRDS